MGKTTQRTAKNRGMSGEEVAAMRERIKELNAGKAGGEEAVLAAIAKMKEPDRSLGKRIHSIIMAAAPDLSPKTWYGMPAYAKGDKVICFFQNAGKFKARYSSIGFSDKANLDDGNMWPIAFALKELTAAEEARIKTLVKSAVS